MPIDNATLAGRLERMRAEALQCVLKSGSARTAEAALVGALSNSRLQLTLNEDAERIFVAETRAAAAYLWYALGDLAEGKLELLSVFAEGLRDDIIARRANANAAAAAFGQRGWKAKCCSNLHERLTALTHSLKFDFENGIVGDQLMKRPPQNIVNISNSNIFDSPFSITQSLTLSELRNELARDIRALASEDEFRDLSIDQKSELNDLTDEALTQIAKSPPDASRVVRKLKQIQGFASNVGAAAASKAIADLILKAAGLFG